MDYSYSERLHAAQDAALERAYMASLEPGDLRRRTFDKKRWPYHRPHPGPRHPRAGREPR